MPKNEWHWEMTDDELWIAFRDAKSRKEIVRILADRNVTTAKRVVDKLREIAAAKGYHNDGLDHIPAIGRYSNAETDIIREMAASGVSIEMIAQKLDRTPGSVDSWMLRNRVYPAANAAIDSAPAEPAKIRVPQAVIDALNDKIASNDPYTRGLNMKIAINRDLLETYTRLEAQLAATKIANDLTIEAIRGYLARCEAEPAEVDHE